MHDGVWFRKNNFGQNDSCENLDTFVYAWIVPLWADQLQPQLLMEQFDTLPLQCRHIEHMICMKEFDFEKIIFDKMTAVRT